MFIDKYFSQSVPHFLIFFSLLFLCSRKPSKGGVCGWKPGKSCIRRWKPSKSGVSGWKPGKDSPSEWRPCRGGAHPVHPPACTTPLLHLLPPLILLLLLSPPSTAAAGTHHCQQFPRQSEGNYGGSEHPGEVLYHLRLSAVLNSFFKIMFCYSVRLNAVSKI